MIRFRAPHPGEEQLLRFADGELRTKETATIRTHLEACWGCRTQLEELERGIGDYVRYHERVLKPHLPDPPRPWADLRGKMERLDRSRETAPSGLRAIVGALTARKRAPDEDRSLTLAAPIGAASVRERLRKGTRLPGQSTSVPPRWLAAAAVFVVACLVVYRFERLPAVSAAELLQRAVAAKPSATREHRQIRVRTRTSSFTRPAWYRVAAGAGSGSVETLFAAASFSWEDPLSARSYAAWRNQLPEKRDEVDSAPGVYRIRTTTDRGALAEATITLRTEDLSAVSGTFQFRGSEWVEIAEVSGEPASPSPAAPAIAQARAEEGAPEAAPATEGAVTEGGPTQELQVIAALHQIGADLGEPIELTHSGRKVLVVGTGIEPERQEEVRSSLARLPGVAVRFDDPKPAIPVESAPKAVAAGATPRALFAAEIEKAVGGRVTFEKFTNRVLDLSEAAMARAHALRNLAERFPSPAEARLGENDKNLLAALRREHARVLAGEAAEIAGLLNPVLQGQPTRVGASLASNWQAGAEQVFASAQEADQLLNVLLAGADTRLSPEEVPGRLKSVLLRFKTRSAAYRDGLGEGMR